MDKINEIDEITKEILELKQQTAQNIIEIGKRLSKIKQSLNHGEFKLWLEEKVDYTPRTAQKFMKVAKTFEKTKSPSLLSSEKLYLLTNLSEEDREIFINSNDIENMSTRELKQAIKEIKKSNKKPIEIKEVKTEINTSIHIPIENDNYLMDDYYEADKIWEDTARLKCNIEFLTGSFDSDNNGDLELDSVESLILTRYLNKEINHNQLEKVIKIRKMDIPFICDEDKFKTFIDSLDIWNDYQHIGENGDRYYSPLENLNLSYENVCEFIWEKNEEERQSYIEDNKYIFNENNITIAKGYIDTNAYICIYNDKKLFAHYPVTSNYHRYLYNITELFRFYRINKRYLKLVDKFIKQQQKDDYEELIERFNRAKETAKFIFEKDNECYMLISYATNRDCIKVYKHKKELTYYIFDVGMCLENLEFYNTIITDNWLDVIKDKLDFQPKYLINFQEELKIKAKKVKEEIEEAQRQQQKNYEDFYKNYNFFGDKKANNSLEIFTENEQKLLKEILKNEKIAKKLYLMAAMEFHPDKVAKNGKSAVKRAEEQMKLLNAINLKIKS